MLIMLIENKKKEKKRRSSRRRRILILKSVFRYFFLFKSELRWVSAILMHLLNKLNLIESCCDHCLVISYKMLRENSDCFRSIERQD